MSSPLPESAIDRPPQHTESATDFHSLVAGDRHGPRHHQPRTVADWIVAGATPLMILVMVSSVVMFLLDVRYVFDPNDEFNVNIRFAATFFILGVVALNRLIARDGRGESVMYIVGLGFATILYTTTALSMFGTGGMVGNLVSQSVILNLCTVMFLWWLTNRLTHECCVDENPYAGEIGIITGTARRMRAAFANRGPKPVALETTYDPVDPRDWKRPEQRLATPTPVAASERLSTRHPGVSIFYFSVPVMVIFAIGQRVVRNGGGGMEMAGHVYMACYTASALSLLMLSSLGGLREYFRARYVAIPRALAPFWVGLGLLMVAMVMAGAVALPSPSMPAPAYVAVRDGFGGVRPPTGAFSTNDIAQYQHFAERAGQVVLVVFGLFMLYAAVRGIGMFAAAIASERHRYPQWVGRLCDALDRFLQRMARLPSLPRWRRQPRISRNVASSVKYANPLGRPDVAQKMSAAELVEYAYDALCALALDLGVPRRSDQTPYEFIESFPRRLRTLREEATELTHLFVVSNYSTQQPDPRILDRLRKFWVTYEQVRRTAIR